LILVLGIFLLVLAILLPAIGRARQSSASIRCGAQLQQIGQGLLVYAGDNHGHVIPWGLDELLRSRLWSSFIFREATPQVVRCPTGYEWNETQTYLLNGWLESRGVRLHGRGLRSRPTSSVPLAGENLPFVQYNYYPAFPPQKDVLAHDPYRHGAHLKSNYLWLDMHVDNVFPLNPTEARYTWHIAP
jgi:hypothetical protein